MNKKKEDLIIEKEKQEQEAIRPRRYLSNKSRKVLEEREKREKAKKKNKKSRIDSTDEGLVIVIKKQKDISDSMSDIDEYLVKQ